MEIQKVSVIGLGALGILFGEQMCKTMPKEDFCIVADQERIDRYTRDGIYYNGKKCDFRYEISGKILHHPDDLIIVGVKFNGLETAIDAIRNRVGKKTLILSLLNGICSEEILSETFGSNKVIPCVAQGMSAVREGTHLTCENAGQIVFGEIESGVISERVQCVSDFFRKTGVPHSVHTDMMHHMWGKLMANVGVNQTVAVYHGTYKIIKKPGEVRDMLIGSMREVMAVSNGEGINLTEEDLNYWIDILDGLDDTGKPSLCQDIEAERMTEVDLFAGTILRLGKKYGIPTPINQYYYDEINKMEAAYGK